MNLWSSNYSNDNELNLKINIHAAGNIFPLRSYSHLRIGQNIFFLLHSPPLQSHASYYSKTPPFNTNDGNVQFNNSPILRIFLNQIILEIIINLSTLLSRRTRDVLIEYHYTYCIYYLICADVVNKFFSSSLKWIDWLLLYIVLKQCCCMIALAKSTYRCDL